jgi:alkanesulfonate monooxygenase
VAQYAAQHTSGWASDRASPGLRRADACGRKIATFDHLTEGRIALHIISGASDAEQEGDGDFAPKDVRYRRAAEYIEVMKLAWSSARRFDFEGEFYKVRGAKSERAAAAAKPHPLIFFGGSSEGALAMGAKHCDVFAMSASRWRRRRSAWPSSRRAPPGSAARPLSTCRSARSFAATEGAAWDRARKILQAVKHPAIPQASATTRSRSTSRRAALLGFAAQGETHDERLWMPIAEATARWATPPAWSATPSRSPARCSNTTSSASTRS